MRAFEGAVQVALGASELALISQNCGAAFTGGCMKEKGEFIVGKRILDDNVEHHWQEVDFSKYKVEKPIILIFGGSGTENNKFANGYAKLIQHLLGSFAEDVDILTVNYNGGITQRENKIENCAYLVDKLFVPLISKDGKKIDVKSACKNVRNITIFAHCMGDLNVSEIFSNLATKMSELHYTESEQRLIFSQIFEISYGVWSLIPDRFPDAPVFNVLSPEDEMWMKTDYFWEMAADESTDVEISSKDKGRLSEIVKKAEKNKEKPCFEAFYNENQRCFVVRDKNRLGLACSGLQKDGYDDHSIDVVARKKDWGRLDTSSEAGDYASRCIACALCNSVANAMLNQKSKEFVPFALDDVQRQMEDFVCTLNKPYEIKEK